MSGNELDILAGWAAGLVARRTHRGLGERLALLPSRGEQLEAGLAHDPAWLLARLPGPPGELDAEAALPLEADLDACRKPFQLWNVHRQLREEPFELEGQEPLHLGPLAVEAVPRRVVVTRSTTELALLEGSRASDWAARAVRDLRRNRRGRIQFGRPASAPPPVFDLPEPGTD